MLCTRARGARASDYTTPPGGRPHPSSRPLSDVCYFRISAQRVLSQIPGLATSVLRLDWPKGSQGVAISSGWLEPGWAPRLWERPCTC